VLSKALAVLGPDLLQFSSDRFLPCSGAHIAENIHEVPVLLDKLDSPEKGPEVFVRAAWIARQSRPDLHFALIGEGPMLERLRTTVSALGHERVLKNFPLKDGADKMAALLTVLGQAGHTAGDRRMTAMPSVSGLASAKKAAGTQKGSWRAKIWTVSTRTQGSV
jgi:hypothetical protein